MLVFLSFGGLALEDGHVPTGGLSLWLEFELCQQAGFCATRWPLGGVSKAY